MPILCFAILAYTCTFITQPVFELKIEEGIVSFQMGLIKNKKKKGHGWSGQAMSLLFREYNVTVAT